MHNQNGPPLRHCVRFEPTWSFSYLYAASVCFLRSFRITVRHTLYAFQEQVVNFDFTRIWAVKPAFVSLHRDMPSVDTHTSRAARRGSGRCVSPTSDISEAGHGQSRR